MSILFIVLAVVAWLGHSFIRSINLHPSKISPFELERLVASGDKTAKLQQRALLLEPKLLGFRHLVGSLLIALMAVWFFGAFGFQYGSFALAAALVLQPWATGLDIIKNTANLYYQRNQKTMLKFCKQYGWLVTWIKVEPQVASSNEKIYSSDELLAIVKNNPELFSEDDAALIENGLTFSQKTVKSTMTQIAKVTTVEHHEILGPLVRDELHKSGHRQFPVIKKSPNHVVGWLKMDSLRDLSDDHQRAEDAMNPEVHNLAHDDSLLDALRACLQTGSHLFIVVNARRETVGIISLSDITRALFGRKLQD